MVQDVCSPTAFHVVPGFACKAWDFHTEMLILHDKMHRYNKCDDYSARKQTWLHTLGRLRPSVVATETSPRVATSRHCKWSVMEMIS